MYESVGEYEKSREHLEKSLAIRKEFGDRAGEACCYGDLGAVYQSAGEYEKSREYHEKSLAIRKEIGERAGEASCYGNLGTVYQSIGEYEKSRQYHEKSLAIRKEIGERAGKACCYGNLRTVYESVGEYEKSREHHEKSLAIRKEIGDRDRQACCYGGLGAVYQSVGEYKKSRVHHEKSLAIFKELGDRRGEAVCYRNFGEVLCCVGNYRQGSDNYQKALAISIDIGDRAVEAASYELQIRILSSIGDSANAKEYFERALLVSQEIGTRNKEASSYLWLGHVHYKHEEYSSAEILAKKGLEISEQIGNVELQFRALQELGYIRVQEGKIPEAISYFLDGIKKCEDMRRSLRDNDQFMISFSDTNINSYREHSALLCQTENSFEGLYVSELGKGRALADLMSTQYSVQNVIYQLIPKHGLVLKESWRKSVTVHVCTSLIIRTVCFFWILSASGAMHFRMTNGKKVIAHDGIREDLNEFLNFRSLGILPEELCEDRSLNCFEEEAGSCEEDSHESPRIPGQESRDNRGPKMNLHLCHKLIIAPVADLLKGCEIIIVPDRALYNVPFAALPDERGKCFTENYRVRLVPSLTTLKLIHESPRDYHCQTGALIVGNPDVGEVWFKSRPVDILRLPFAEREAKMVGEKLDVKPLIGQYATKQAVLEAMNSVALIHIAAHGDAEGRNCSSTDLSYSQQATSRRRLLIDNV